MRKVEDDFGGELGRGKDFAVGADEERFEAVDGCGGVFEVGDEYIVGVGVGGA